MNQGHWLATASLFLLSLLYPLHSYSAVVEQLVQPWLTSEKCQTFEHVLVDKEGNVITVAQCEAGAKFVRKVFKLSSTGSKLWKSATILPSFNRLGTVALDDAGNVIIAGSVATNTNYTRSKAVIMKLNSAGKLGWTREFYALVEPTVTEDIVNIPALAFDGVDIYLAKSHFQFTSKIIYLANGGYQEVGQRGFSVSYMKLSETGNVLWQRDEPMINVDRPYETDGYAWSLGSKFNFMSISQATLYDLSLCFKEGMLYTQHGALLQVINGVSGALALRQNAPYFYGRLKHGQNGEIYSLGLSGQSATDLRLAKLNNVLQISEISRFSFSADAVYGVSDVAIDRASQLFVTGCRSSDGRSCQIYTARLGVITGSGLEIALSPIWQSVLEGVHGNKIAVGESGVYTAGEFKSTSKVKALLTYKK